MPDSVLRNVIFFMIVNKRNPRHIAGGWAGEGGWQVFSLRGDAVELLQHRADTESIVAVSFIAISDGSLFEVLRKGVGVFIFALRTR